MKIVDKILAWIYIYLTKKKQTQEKEKVDKDRERVVAELRQVYTFIRWLNTKCLKNRHERKTFWRRVNDNEEQIPETITKLIKAYKNESSSPNR